MDVTCSLCEKPVKARGWCQTHYRRWQRHGDPETRVKIRNAGTIEQRFWARVDKNGPGDCWVWTGSRFQNGGGQFSDENSRSVSAYRWGYQHFVGPVPRGLELDHLCRNRACVRFDHLEPVTHHQNVQRGKAVKWLGSDCAIEGCNRPAKLHGLCRTHYLRQWRASRR